MKKAAFVIFVLALFLVMFWSRFAFSAEQSDKMQILQIEKQTAIGEQQNDLSMMHLLSDDFVIAGGAKELTKKQFVENVKNNFAAHENGINPYTIEKKNMQVYVFGDTAVATYLKEYKQTGDASHAFAEDDTDILTRSSSGWLIRMNRLSRPTS